MAPGILLESDTPAIVRPDKKTNRHKTRHAGTGNPIKVEKSPPKTKKTSSEKKKKEKKKKEVKEEKKLEDEAEDDEVDEEIRALCNGSPWDATVRRNLNVEDLDLDKSYVEQYKDRTGKVTETKSDLPERRPRWKHNGLEPLTDISQLAEMGWDSREPDLDPDDLQAQIVRCKERIEDNIMPSYFEDRLKALEAQNAANLELVASEKQGLSWPVLGRIKELQDLETAMTQGNEPKDQLVNVRSILAAYRSQTLEWTGLVTYWVKGTQVSQPRPFDWDEFEAINDAHGRPQSFWVEGMDSLRDTFEGASATTPGTQLAAAGPGIPRIQHLYNIAVRLPGRDWWTELGFMYDTGSSNMSILEADVNLIAGPHRDPVRCMGSANIVTSSAHTVRASLVQLEATILDRDGKRMCPWLRIPCSVKMDLQARNPRTIAGSLFDIPRLDGGAFRQYFYYMTCPELLTPLIISDSRRSLIMASRRTGHVASKKDRVQRLRTAIGATPAGEAAPAEGAEPAGGAEPAEEAADVPDLDLDPLDEAGIARLEATRRALPGVSSGVPK